MYPGKMLLYDNEKIPILYTVAIPKTRHIISRNTHGYNKTWDIINTTLLCYI